MDEVSSTEQKTCQSTVLDKELFFRLHLNESREGFLLERKGKVIVTTTTAAAAGSAAAAATTTTTTTGTVDGTLKTSN